LKHFILPFSAIRLRAMPFGFCMTKNQLFFAAKWVNVKFTGPDADFLRFIEMKIRKAESIPTLPF